MAILLMLRVAPPVFVRVTGVVAVEPVPCVPKFILVVLSVTPGGATEPLMDWNAARSAPQTSEDPRVAVAEAVPANGWIWSSTASFVFGAAGAVSSILYPL